MLSCRVQNVFFYLPTREEIGTPKKGCVMQHLCRVFFQGQKVCLITLERKNPAMALTGSDIQIYILFRRE